MRGAVENQNLYMHPLFSNQNMLMFYSWIYGNNMKEQPKKDMRKKKDINLKIKGTLNEVLLVAVKGNPKPKKKSK